MLEIKYPIKFSFWNIFTMIGFYLRLKKGEGAMFGPFLCSTSPTTHVGESENAIDFLCKTGTEVLAVRKGNVLKIEDGFNGFGGKEKDAEKINYIVIQHEIGEKSYYLHLECGSVTNRGLKIGDQVRQGQVIGNVDNNGYMKYDEKMGPPLTHLHFEYRKNCGSSNKSIKPTFEDGLFDEIKKIIILFFLKCRS